MEITMNLINSLFNKYLHLQKDVDDLNQKYLINIALSKLDFSAKYHKMIKNNNIINIKSHNYFINVFNDNDNNDNKDDNIINKCLLYEQHLIFNKTFNGDSYVIPPPCYYNDIINNIDCYKDLRKPNLFICVKYANITIDLIEKNYKITQSYFNIRKPTNDKYNYFSDIINNIDNPSYYFINNYKKDNDKNNDKKDIYFIPNDIIFTNDIKKIIIKPIMQEKCIISIGVDIEPLLSNEIRIKEYEGSFI
jgi:hypothetical protein